MNHSDHEMLLSAYLDDEATGEERAEVERLLVENAEFRRLHRELVALRQRLQGLPKAKLDADFARRVVTMARARAAEAEGTNGSSLSVLSANGAAPEGKLSKASGDVPPGKNPAGQGGDAPTPASISIHTRREKSPGWYWQLSAAAAAIGLLVVVPFILTNSHDVKVSSAGAKDADVKTDGLDYSSHPEPMVLRSPAEVLPPRGDVNSRMQQSLDDGPQMGFGGGGPGGGGLGSNSTGGAVGAGGMAGGRASPGGMGGAAQNGQYELAPVDQLVDKDNYLYSGNADSIANAVRYAVAKVEANEHRANRMRTNRKEQNESFSLQRQDALELAEQRAKDEFKEAKPQADASVEGDATKEVMSRDESARNEISRNETPANEAAPLNAKDEASSLARRSSRDSSGATRDGSDVNRDNSNEELAFQESRLSTDRPVQAVVVEALPRSLALQKELAQQHDSVRLGGQFDDATERKSELGTKSAESDSQAGDSTLDNSNGPVPLATTAAGAAAIDALRPNQDFDTHFFENRRLGELDGARVLLLDLDAPETQAFLEEIQPQLQVVKSYGLEWSRGKQVAGEPIESEQTRAMGRSSGFAKSQAGSQKSEGAEGEGLTEKRDERLRDEQAGDAPRDPEAWREESDSDVKLQGEKDRESPPQPRTQPQPEPPPLPSAAVDGPVAETPLREVPPSEMPAPEQATPSPPRRRVATDSANSEEGTSERGPSERGNAAPNGIESNKLEEAGTAMSAESRLAPGAMSKKLSRASDEVSPHFDFGSRVAEDGRPYVWEFRWQKRGLIEEEQEDRSVRLEDAFGERGSGESVSDQDRDTRAPVLVEPIAVEDRKKDDFGAELGDLKGVDKPGGAGGVSNGSSVDKKVSPKKAPSSSSEELTEKHARGAVGDPAPADTSPTDGEAKGNAETITQIPAQKPAGKPDTAKSNVVKSNAAKAGTAKSDADTADDAKLKKPKPADQSMPAPASAPAPAAAGPIPAPPAPALRPEASNAPQKGAKVAQRAEQAENLSKESQSKESMPKNGPASVATAETLSEPEATLEQEEMRSEETTRFKQQRGETQLHRFGSQAASRPRWLVIIVPNASADQNNLERAGQHGGIVGRESAKTKAGANESPEPASPAPAASPGK